MSASVYTGAGRRRFLLGGSALCADVLSRAAGAAPSDPPPETRTIRLVHDPAICLAPQYLAEEFLRMEGFAQVVYVDSTPEPLNSMVESGKVDFSMDNAAAIVYAMDAARNTVSVGGIHVGCYELFGHGRVRSIRDLRGKSISVYGVNNGDHVMLSSMLAYVGIDPRSDVNWIVSDQPAEAMRRFADGKADAFLGFAPQPQELRARGVGRLILDTAQDRPWSQYFCCMLIGNRNFITRYPVATKRALRAFMKAADVCASEPQRVARFLADRGYEPRYEIGLEVLKELPYQRWRDTHPEDTLRFHALRLHEVGMIKSTPQKILAQGTNWRFLNELKKEMKA